MRKALIASVRLKKKPSEQGLKKKNRKTQHAGTQDVRGIPLDIPCWELEKGIQKEISERKFSSEGLEAFHVKIFEVFRL